MTAPTEREAVARIVAALREVDCIRDGDAWFCLSRDQAESYLMEELAPLRAELKQAQRERRNANSHLEAIQSKWGELARRLSAAESRASAAEALIAECETVLRSIRKNLPENCITAFSIINDALAKIHARAGDGA